MRGKKGGTAKEKAKGEEMEKRNTGQGGKENGVGEKSEC